MSYLNAKPLIANLDQTRCALELMVPAALPEALAQGRLDVALCPVIDYHRLAPAPTLLKAGAIGCDGPTHTVRVFSRVPLDAVRRVMVDPESHSSVALLHVLLDRPDRTIQNVAMPVPPRELDLTNPEHQLDCDAVLLIGDKVVTAPPPEAMFPHHLDLGGAWKDATGLPFVFAVWLARPGVDPDLAGELLASARERDRAAILALAEEHASAHGWPVDLAQRYMTEILCYDLGPRQREAIAAYSERAHALGLIPTARDIPTQREPQADAWPHAPQRG